MPCCVLNKVLYIDYIALATIPSWGATHSSRLLTFNKNCLYCSARHYFWYMFLFSVFCHGGSHQTIDVNATGAEKDNALLMPPSGNSIPALHSFSTDLAANQTSSLHQFLRVSLCREHQCFHCKAPSSSLLSLPWCTLADLATLATPRAQPPP